MKIDSKSAALPAPNPLPKVGDEVNVVNDAKAVSAKKVIAVNDKHNGRQVTVVLDSRPDKKGIIVPVTTPIPYRQVEAGKTLVGGTWHWPKAAALILMILALALGFSAQAQFGIPNYTTLSDGGNASSPAQVYFPAIAGEQVRVVSVGYQGDTNNAALQFLTGGTAFFETVTNPGASGVTNWISGTNGLIAGSTLVLDESGIGYPATLASFGAVSGTNSVGVTTNAYFIVLNSGGWGVAVTLPANIYQMVNPVSLPVGVATNVLNGDAIYAGKTSRPLLVTLTPALHTNLLSTVTGRYQ